MPFDKTSLTDNPAMVDPNRQETHVAPAPSLLPVYAGLVLFLAAMAASVMIFGLPGLYIPAVAMVPVMFVILIRISLG